MTHTIPQELADALRRAEQAAQGDRFEDAERELAESLRLHPGNATAWHRRGRMRLLRGAFDGAVEDLAEAARLDESLAHHHQQALAVSGRLAKPAGPYWTGVLAAREGRLAAARKAFERAKEPRAALLAWVCRAREEAEPGPEPLRLVGLGYRKLEHMTVEGARALEGCRSYAAVCNVADDDVLDLLACYPGTVTPVLFRGSDAQARAAAETVAGLPAKAALVTRGHPLIYGQLAETLLKLSPGCRVFPAVSGFEVLSAAAGAAGSGPLQVVGAFDVEGLDPRRPAVVYFPGEPRALREAAARLSESYDEAWLLPNSGPQEFEPRRLPASRLAEEAAKELPCAVFFSPRS